jgi:hypothetical protein
MDEQLVQTPPHHSLSMAYQVMNPYKQDQKTVGQFLGSGKNVNLLKFIALWGLSTLVDD